MINDASTGGVESVMKYIDALKMASEDSARLYQMHQDVLLIEDLPNILLDIIEKNPHDDTVLFYSICICLRIVDSFDFYPFLNTFLRLLFRPPSNLTNVVSNLIFQIASMNNMRCYINVHDTTLQLLSDQRYAKNALYLTRLLAEININVTFAIFESVCRQMNEQNILDSLRVLCEFSDVFYANIREEVIPQILLNVASLSEDALLDLCKLVVKLFPRYHNDETIFQFLLGCFRSDSERVVFTAMSIFERPSEIPFVEEVVYILCELAGRDDYLLESNVSTQALYSLSEYRLQNDGCSAIISDVVFNHLLDEPDNLYKVRTAMRLCSVISDEIPNISEIIDTFLSYIETPIRADLIYLLKEVSLNDNEYSLESLDILFKLFHEKSTEVRAQLFDSVICILSTVRSVQNPCQYLEVIISLMERSCNEESIEVFSLASQFCESVAELPDNDICCKFTQISLMCFLQPRNKCSLFGGLQILSFLINKIGNRVQDVFQQIAQTVIDLMPNADNTTLCHILRLCSNYCKQVQTDLNEGFCEETIPYIKESLKQCDNLLLSSAFDAIHCYLKYSENLRNKYLNEVYNLFYDFMITVSEHLSEDNIERVTLSCTQLGLYLSEFGLIGILDHVLDFITYYLDNSYEVPTDNKYFQEINMNQIHILIRMRSYGIDPDIGSQYIHNSRIASDHAPESVKAKWQQLTHCFLQMYPRFNNLFSEIPLG